MRKHFGEFFRSTALILVRLYMRGCKNIDCQGELCYNAIMKNMGFLPFTEEYTL